MQKKKSKKAYFFVDESGAPYFYNRRGEFIVGREGCSKILLLGLIKTENPELLRSELEKVRKSIAGDAYLHNIPSVKKSLQTFHATDDCPEVRERVFKAIRDLPFKSEFIVARKIEKVFTNRHKKRSNIFYDDLISKLFQNQLHQSEENIIYFAARTNRARQIPLDDAIHKALMTFESKWSTRVDSQTEIFPQRPEGEPCLQIIDYMNWAVQRAFLKKEMRYVEFMESKISLIADIYDFSNYPNVFYNKKNPFHVNKISPQ